VSRFIKSHGLGNDYLVSDGALALSPARVEALCDRHEGIGGDGILEEVPSTRAAYGLRIWNPDGSLAEKSGNGLRIFARYLFDHRGAPPLFTVETAGGLVTCAIADDGSVEVEMGWPTFEPAEIPCARPLRLTPIALPDRTLALTAVGMGNPHCVAFFDEPLDALPWTQWGAQLTDHPLFPNRTNVQFARILSDELVELRIFERGAGPTRASGSGACAVVAVGQALGRLGPAVQAQMPGGLLHLRRGADGQLIQRGPVVEVGVFCLSAAAVSALPPALSPAPT